MSPEEVGADGLGKQKFEGFSHHQRPVWIQDDLPVVPPVALVPAPVSVDAVTCADEDVCTAATVSEASQVRLLALVMHAGPSKDEATLSMCLDLLREATGARVSQHAQSVEDPAS